MSSIILYHHLGLGDHIMCHGIVREYCKKYEKAAIFTLPQNYPSVSFMYKDLKNLTIIKGDKIFAQNFISANASKPENEKYDYVKIVGFQNLNWHSAIPLEKQFYNIAGVDLSKKWDNFFIERDLQRERNLFKKSALKEDYAFVHDDVKRNYKIKEDKIGKNLKIFKPNPELTDNIFDYITIIENAKEIHVIDSSFMFLIDCLKYENPNQKLFIHRYARENDNWKLPILKKDWQVFTLKNNTRELLRYIPALLYKYKMFFLNHIFIKRAKRKFRTITGKHLNPQIKPDTENLIRRYVPGKSFIDISCMWKTSGKNAFIAEDAGAAKTTLLDSCPETEEFINAKNEKKSSVNFILGEIISPDITNKIEQHDIVFCDDILHNAPDILYFLKCLNTICNETLILYTSCIPEIPGMKNISVFLPMLDSRQMSFWKKNKNYEQESGHTDIFWRLTPSCIDSLLQCAGFEIKEKYIFPYEASFVCRLKQQ